MELKFHGIGAATIDSELKTINEKTNLAQVNLAFNRNYKDAQGEWKKETTFARAKMWGARAEKFSLYTKKGQQVFVEGYVTQENWEDKDGKKRTALSLTVTNFAPIEKVTNGESETKTVTTKASPPVSQKTQAVKTAKLQPAQAQVAVTEEEQNDEIPF